MKIMDLQSIGNAGIFTWTRDYLFKVLTTGKNPSVSDPKLIAAFRQVDRKDFVPNQYKHRAYEDIDLEIGYGEALTRPTTLAYVAELLKVRPGGKYLDIGTGSGYFAMVMGYTVGPEGKVYTIERIQWLWEMARSASTKYKDIKNVTYLYRDGLTGLPEQAPFNGIHIGFALDEVPDNIKMQLDVNAGRLICPTTSHDIRLVERHGIDEFVEEIIPGFIFQKGKEGTA